MTFMSSASKVHLVDGHILKAVLKKRDGSTCEAELDLDDFIGNEEGRLEWDGVKFSHSAYNINLEGSLLTAELSTGHGDYKERHSIELGNRIGNEDGYLVYYS